MTEGSLGSGRRWCKHEVSSVIWRRVVRFAAVNINIYGIHLEKRETVLGITFDYTTGENQKPVSVGFRFAVEYDRVIAARRPLCRWR